MSGLETIERALWEAERDWRLVDLVQMNHQTEAQLLMSDNMWHSIRPIERTIFGIPIVLDPSMPLNEIKLVADCGCVVKLINIGRDE